jgi:hypothetical protein
MPTATLDRIEGEVALLEADGRPWALPAAWLPEGVREGDRVVVTLAPDPEATRAAHARTAERRARAARDDDGGDFTL